MAKRYHSKLRVLTQSPFERTKIKNAKESQAQAQKREEEICEAWTLSGSLSVSAKDAMIFIEAGSGVLTAKRFIWSTDVG